MRSIKREWRRHKEARQGQALALLPGTAMGKLAAGRAAAAAADAVPHAPLSGTKVPGAGWLADPGAASTGAATDATTDA